jgi:hypothetical protein
MISPSDVKLNWNTKYSGSVRSNVTRTLEGHATKSLDGVRIGHVKNIQKIGDEFELDVEFENVDKSIFKRKSRFHKVISCCGFRIDTSIYKDCTKPLLNEKK